MRSPTTLTLNYLRKKGCTCGVVERFVRTPKTQFRADLFGCIDLICIVGTDLVGVQASSAANHSARVTKALSEPRLRLYLATSNHFQVWTWRKSTKRKRWIPRVSEIVIDELNRLVVKPFIVAE